MSIKNSTSTQRTFHRVRPLALLACAGIMTSCMPKSTLHPTWAAYPANTIAVIGFLPAGPAIAKEDTIPIEEWWNWDMNQDLTDSLRRNYTDFSFMDPVQLRRKLSDATWDSLTSGLLGAFKSAATERGKIVVIDIDRVPEDHLRKFLDAAGAQALLVGVHAPGGGVRKSGFIVRNRTIGMTLATVLYLVNRTGLQLWTASRLFSTQQDRGLTSIFGSDPDLTSLWRTNGQNLVDASVSFFGSIFPNRDATLPPDLPRPKLIPLIIADAEKVQIHLPPGGPWAVDIENAEGAVIKSFPNTGNKLTWDYATEGTGKQHGDYTLVLKPMESPGDDTLERRFLLRIPEGS